MALFMDEAELWKCPKHPSRRRKSGICPKCLRERLVTLCPDCASALPCSSCPPPIDSSSSSSSSTSSSSFSLFSFSRGGSRRDFPTNCEAGRLPNPLEIDPVLRRSRSSAIPFLRSRSRYVGSGVNGMNGCEAGLVAENNKTVPNVPKDSRSKINFLSAFTLNKSKKCDIHSEGMEDESNKVHDSAAVDGLSMMMIRSRSVAVGAGNVFGRAGSKRKGWNFPTPMKGFLHSKPPESVAVS